MTTTEETIAELSNHNRREPVSGAVRLGVMTDLHLSGKPWTVRKALRMAGENSAVLCDGDMVNDGLPEQYALLHTAVSQVLPDTPLLAVAGNHDYPTCPSHRSHMVYAATIAQNGGIKMRLFSNSGDV